MRILLDGMPQMLRTIITDIVSDDPQCEIVAEVTAHDDLFTQLRKTPADVIILAVSYPDEAPDHFTALLAAHPATRIIAIASGGSHAFHFDMRPHVTRIDRLSPAVLLSAIRQSPAVVSGGA